MFYDDEYGYTWSELGRYLREFARQQRIDLRLWWRSKLIKLGLRKPPEPPMEGWLLVDWADHLKALYNQTPEVSPFLSLIGKSSTETPDRTFVWQTYEDDSP